MTGETEILLPSAGLSVFASTEPEQRRGYLIYGQDAALFAAPFDIDQRETGPVRPIVDEVFGLSGLNFAAVSRSGTLAYVDGDLITESSSLNWIDRNGTTQSVVETPRVWGEVALSPDGMRAAGGMIDLGEEIMADIWTIEFDGGRIARTTFQGFNGSIVWTPDSQRLFYSAFENVTQSAGRVESVPTDNSAAPTNIIDFTAFQGYPTSISPDGGVLIGTADRNTAIAGGDIWALDLDESSGEPAFAMLLETDFAESHATFSPDGRWIAYVSNESGIEQVYVVPYPGPGGKSQVSTDGGRQPRWNPAGGEIFYLNGQSMMAVEIETESGFRAGNPRQLFQDPALLNGPTNAAGFQYAVAPDGERFLVLASGNGTGLEPRLRVVENWFQELKDLVPAD
jgi:serine/threonine-protein kinase